MGQELVQVLCPECGVPGDCDPQLSRCQCSNCGNAFFLRRCSECDRVSYVDGLQGFRMPWPCTRCGRFNRGFSQNRDPASASAIELATELAGNGRPHPVNRATDRGGAVRVQVPASRPVPASRDATDRDLAAQARIDAPRAEPPLPGQAGVARRSARRSVRRAALLVGLAGACAAGALVLVAAGSPRAAGMATRPGHGVTKAVRVTAGRVGGIDLRGVSGQLTITGTGSSQVTLTGQLQGASGAADLETQFDRADDVLVVSVRCAAGSPCTENLRLAVPAGTSAAVRQPSGRIVVIGLSGPLSITAANVDVSASGLRSPELAAVISNGHLSAAFITPPRQVSITLASAQATLRIPADAAYRVSQQVASGYVNVGIPQASDAPRAVIARIDSGELELLPSTPAPPPGDGGSGS